MNRTEYLEALKRRQQMEEEMRRIEEELHSATHGEVSSGQPWKLDGKAVEIEGEEGEEVYVYINIEDISNILNALALENYEDILQVISPFDEAPPPASTKIEQAEEEQVEKDAPTMEFATEKEITEFATAVMDLRHTKKGMMPLLFLHGPASWNPAPKRVPGTVLEITRERSVEEIAKHIKDVMTLSTEPYLRTGLTLVTRERRKGQERKVEKVLHHLVLRKTTSP